jgi:hypothetical protein
VASGGGPAGTVGLVASLAGRVAATVAERGSGRPDPVGQRGRARWTILAPDCNLEFRDTIKTVGSGNVRAVRATSHTRLRANDHYTSSTLIGGKGGAGPSSLHTTLEGPTEYVNTRWM